MYSDNILPHLVGFYFFMCGFHVQEKPELRKAAQEEWNSINKILTETLRAAASKAFNSGSIGPQEKEKFFISGT